MNDKWCVQKILNIIIETVLYYWNSSYKIVSKITIIPLWSQVHVLRCFWCNFYGGGVDHGGSWGFNGGSWGILRLSDWTSRRIPISIMSTVFRATFMILFHWNHDGDYEMILSSTLLNFTEIILMRHFSFIIKATGYSRLRNVKRTCVC